MMRIGWNSAKKKVGIGRLIDWLVGIPSLLEFRHCWNSVIAREQSGGAISFIKPYLLSLVY